MAGPAIAPPKVSYLLDTDPKYSVKACDVARVICKSERFARDVGGWLHVYRKGVYVPDGKQTIARLVLRVVQVSCRRITGRPSSVMKPSPGSPMGLLCSQNGRPWTWSTSGTASSMSALRSARASS